MTGIFWHIFIYTALFLFLAMMAYRIIAIMKMPVHLRWELAPIPHEKGKNKYGGSYLEEFEWWQKKRQKSLMAIIIYMAKEILLLKGVWKNNRSLWPFSFSLHTGIYLVIISAVLHFVNAMVSIAGASGAVPDAFRGIAAVIAIVGYILGSLGAVGLFVKRTTDTKYRDYSTLPVYFRLVFLAAIFISGIFAWFYAADFASELSLFVSNLLTLNSGITMTMPLTVHIIIALLFIVYLPLTDMVHFITKFFTYHAVRWNDEPMDKKMEEKLHGLAAQSLSWSASHIKADGKRNWVDMTEEETGEKEKP
jgi:nitrate reductase gamma subunit